ncbi:EamA family transporter RarD [Psychrobacter sp. HD31]|uniref:EamA family transporter RarD n=1 Tax=Psychrobacter sp. HD31 TaxID=3112003 RepID=UPI003DA2CC5B
MQNNQNTPTIRLTNSVVETTSQGVLTALAAFIIWGAFPLYFKQLADYNAVEIIAHRIIWTFLCLLIFIVVTKRFNWIKTFKNEPKWLMLTFLSGLIITSNWLTYVWAVNNERLLEASLGYFMSPLVGVMLSLLVLQEKLRKLQWVAISIATLAVFSQIIMLGNLPWVSLVLSLSFAVYGLMQRKTPLTAVEGLFIETTLVVPIALLWLSHANVASSNISFWFDDKIWFLMLAGPITLVPLLLFNKSTKMVAFSILSFMNYLTPSFVFLLAVFYYHEPFDSHRFMLFSMIWLGLLLFSIDLWQNRPSKKQRLKQI